MKLRWRIRAALTMLQGKSTLETRAAIAVLQGKPALVKVTIRNGVVELTDGTAFYDVNLISNCIDCMAGSIDLGTGTVSGYVEILGLCTQHQAPRNES